MSREEEERYRTSSLAADVAQARVVIPLVLVVTVVFAANDYAFLGLSWPFLALSILRLALVAAGILLLRHLRTLTGFRSYDRALLAWNSFFVLVLGASSAARPPSFVAHTIVAAVAVLVTLLAIPNRFVYQVGVSAAIVAVDTVASVHSLRSSPQASLTTLLSIFAAGAVAFVAAWQLHHHRRREFLHREREDAARAAAESDLAERRRTEERLRATLESIADGFFACDEEWRFVYVNAPAERMLGIGRPEVLGKVFWEVFPLTLGTNLERQYRRAAAGEVRDFENFYEPWERWFHNRCFPREGGGLSVYFEDITERKRLESRTALHGTVTSILAESATLAEAAPRFLQEVGGQVGAKAGELWLVDDAARRLRRLCAWQAPGTGADEVLAQGVTLELAPDEGLPGQVWASRAPVWVADLSRLPELPRGAAVARSGLRSLLAFPILLGADVLGVVAFAGARPQAEDPDLLQAVDAIGSQLGQFIQRTEAVQALDQSQRDLDRAQAVGQIGWWRLDTRRNVLTWSDETYRICGVARGTPLTYQSFLAVVHTEDRAYVDEKWNAGLRGEPYDIEHRLLVDGQVKWVREKAFLEFDDAGGLRGGFGITQDVTERKRAELGLQQVKEELERRVRERTAELASTVESLREEVGRRTKAQQALRERSNQLRRLAAELTLAEEREQRRLAELLHDELQQLLAAARFRTAMLAGTAEQEEVRQAAALVQSLLDQSIEWSHSLTGELSPTVLQRKGLVAALEWLVPWMKDKHGLTVSLDVEPGLTLASEDVALLLFRSVRELLFNTVKHAGVKKAGLRVRHQDGQVEIEVSDEGAGFVPMPADAMSRSGGFGLFSVRERIGLLGGEMEIDSAPGRGSRIRLRVAPAAVPTLTPPEATATSVRAVAIDKPQAVPAPARSSARHEARGRIRVVVADDHAVALQGLTDLLSAAPDIEVVGQAADGEAAVEMACQLLPDLVIMDVSMPRMDGIEATRAIRNALPDVPVIGLSMFEEGERAESMHRAGAVAYLTKSGPVSALLDTVRRFGAPRSATDAVPRRGVSVRARKNATPRGRRPRP